MTDIDRLRSWMEGRKLNMKSLARDMEMPYITVHTVVKRRERITDQFVTRFIRRYGIDEASRVFKTHLAPAKINEVAQGA